MLARRCRSRENALSERLKGCPDDELWDFNRQSKNPIADGKDAWTSGCDPRPSERLLSLAPGHAPLLTPLRGTANQTRSSHRCGAQFFSDASRHSPRLPSPCHNMVAVTAEDLRRQLSALSPSGGGRVASCRLFQIGQKSGQGRPLRETSHRILSGRSCRDWIGITISQYPTRPHYHAQKLVDLVDFFYQLVCGKNRQAGGSWVILKRLCGGMLGM